MDKIIYPKISYKINGLIFDVYNSLGYGYQEKYYQKAIAKELDSSQIEYAREKVVPIYYKKDIIGNYRLDFLIDNKIILEIKVGNDLNPNYIKQVLGYLRHLKLKLAIIAIITPNGVVLKRIIL